MKFSLKNSIRWSVFISILTFILASIFTVISTTLLAGVTWAIGIIIVLLVIMVGILFDQLGLAAAAADEVPFHGMASEKVPGSKQAIYIVRNADRFSNFCNDVVGDICGVISGAAAATVVIKLLSEFGNGDEWLRTAVTVVFTALVSALTVGGKAVGKSFAIHYSTDIVLVIGKIFNVLERRLGIKIFYAKRPKKNGKRGKQSARKH